MLLPGSNEGKRHGYRSQRMQGESEVSPFLMAAEFCPLRWPGLTHPPLGKMEAYGYSRNVSSSISSSKRGGERAMIMHKGSLMPNESPIPS